jgi:hypothetical protein
MASQATRLALVNAAAEAAKSRAATKAARAATSLSSVPEEGQEQEQGQLQPSSSSNRGQKLPLALKQPLRVLPTGLQEQILAGQRALENSSSTQQRVCIYIHIYICTYLYIYVYIFVCMLMYMHMHMYTYVYIHIDPSRSTGPRNQLFFLTEGMYIQKYPFAFIYVYKYI